jgi:preprotein translocase subunit SecE
VVNIWNRFTAFVREVMAELKKVSWPSRQETVESTSVVLMTVVLVTLFIGLCDMMLAKLLNMILGQGR